MGLRDSMLSLPLEQRFSYDAEQNVFFINFERLAVRSVEDIERIRHAIEARLAPLEKKVFGIVNYESFTIAPELTDAFGEMVQQLVDHFYYGVTRYTTSSFLRLKLGEALQRRQCRPRISTKAPRSARAPAGAGTEGRDGLTAASGGDHRSVGTYLHVSPRGRLDRLVPRHRRGRLRAGTCFPPFGFSHLHPMGPPAARDRLRRRQPLLGVVAQRCRRSSSCACSSTPD